MLRAAILRSLLAAALCVLACAARADEGNATIDARASRELP
jgi:hypothetical protein